jgi:predicted ATPase
MDSAARQRAQADVLIQLVEAASRAAPILLTIEDLHWADKLTLTYVAALARATPRSRALLVLTSRADGDPLAGGFRASLTGLRSRDPRHRAALDADAVTLAGGLFATSASALARKCIERAGGNPLFLEQLLRTAEESDDRLPASLHSLVLARVDRLPERERTALRAAGHPGAAVSARRTAAFDRGAGLRLRNAACGIARASRWRGIAVRARADP